MRDMKDAGETPALHSISSASRIARATMPLVKIHLRKGKSPEYIRAVADGIHAALVAHANVPADDRFQLVSEYASDDIIAHPSYAGVTRTENLIIIEITLNVGRMLD